MTTSLLPWPPLPTAIRDHLEPGDNGPHPWDLSSLTDPLATAVWTWLDEVAYWLNDTYAWQEHQVIPACWPHHPDIAHDLAALAFTRIDVYAAATPAYIPRWRTDLEDFHRRLTTTLGPNAPCLRDKHNDLPHRYTTDTANLAISTRSTAQGPTTAPDCKNRSATPD
ncbi:hypothetical protein ACTWP5_15590 [Streptomyces sp. 4N509B]|uniref:hypothetical protein n=1 Tax=Streptomyces sp. 4N509B TaxID=3457413 RepID=UPI003FD641E9